MLAGCGGSQRPIGAMPQSAPIATQTHGKWRFSSNAKDRDQNAC
jgi:hypothetical protein